MRHALRGDAHELVRHVAHALLQPRLAGLPADAAEPVEFARLGAVARQKLEILDRQEQPVAAGVMDLQAIMRRARRLDGLQADEAADAVVDMDDEIAGGERAASASTSCARRLRFDCRTSRSPRISCSPIIAKIGGLETVLQRDDRERQRAGARGLRLRIGGDELQRFQPMLGEHMAEPLARAVGPAGDDDRQALLAQRPHVGDGGLEHIDVLVLPFGREIATDPAAAVDDVERIGRRLERVSRATGCAASRSFHSPSLR